MTAVNRLILPAALALSLALTACSGEDSQADSGHGGGHDPAASATAAAGDHNHADVMFSQEMVPHHKQAVQMSVLAETRAASPQVKQLAAKIKGAQDPEIATMTGWLSAWGESPAMDHEMSGDMGGNGMMSTAELDELKKATGPAFDRLFLELMIKHHEGAVASANVELAEGAHGPSKTLAQSIVDGQNAEITTMKSLLS
ncbi:DUF305 domain-containing protein [Actinocorallia lasiicapitis]